MDREFIILCSKDLVRITKPENESAPEADPHPVIAGIVPGPYPSAEDAEKAIIGFDCDGHHFITEVMIWKRLQF